MENYNYYSPNFTRKKRSINSIKIIVIHYTGMQSERESIMRLCNPRSKVSSHFVINQNGKIYRLVEDRYIAWHAGKSCWGRYRKLNKSSIGIELVNKGHQFVLVVHIQQLWQTKHLTKNLILVLLATVKNLGLNFYKLKKKK